MHLRCISNPHRVTRSPASHCRCLAFACSRDGVRWSRPKSLLSCEVDVFDRGDRTIHHPVAGLVRRGDMVWLYVHENVPGIVEKSKLMHKSRLQSVPASRIVRHTIPADALLRWTREALWVSVAAL
jgi:hypothetical protein